MCSRSPLAFVLVCAAPLVSAQGVVATGKPAKSSRPSTEPFFLATEGPAGTGNALEYDELLSLGTVQVGHGPNAGTLVRVTNAGRGPMAFFAPRVIGTNASDFAVDVESSTLPLVAELELPQVASPFHRLASVGGAGFALAIDAQGLSSLGGYREVALREFALPDLGPVTLLLRRRELPFTADSKLVVDGVEVPGGPRSLVGGLQVWGGAVSGIEGSRVFLVVDESAARGFVELPLDYGETLFIGSDAPGRMQIVADRELPALGVRPPVDFCRGELFAPQRTPPSSSGLGDPSTEALTVANCRLALETDWQLYHKFNSASRTTVYVTGLVAAASDQYFTDVQTTLSIAYLGLHTTSNDGWTTQDTGGDTGALLAEFRARWGVTWPAEADLAHFLSGASLGGGVAYVNVLCDPSFGYGVSANLDANIIWGSWTGAPGDFWDFMVFTHELGHNFGSLHTHDYCPPLDQCYDNCNGTNVCTRGTIMSYCHLCAGGVSNVDLHFHPVNANIMRQRVNASCLRATSLAAGDFLQYRVRLNPLFTAGAKSATLEFAHDAPNEARPFHVRLSGIAN